MRKIKSLLFNYLISLSIPIRIKNVGRVSVVWF